MNFTLPTSYSGVFALASQVADEIAEGANTAERVGGFMKAIVNLATMPYDAGGGYKAGQYVYYNDAIYRAKELINIGESPALASAKWKPIGGVDDFQIITDRGASTTNIIGVGGLSRPVTPATSEVAAVAGWVTRNGRDFLEKINLGQTAPVTKSYRAGIDVNTCTTLSGYIVDVNSPNTPASFLLYIDNNLITTITATTARPDVNALFGITTNTSGNIYGWSASIPGTYQNNLVHTINIVEVGTGAVRATANTPGNCTVGGGPTPSFIIDGHYTEIPAAPGSNPPPIVVAKHADILITSLSDETIYFDPTEFSDPGDTLTFNATGWNNGADIAFPAGVTYNKAAQALTIASTVPTGTSFLVKRTATDTANQFDKYFLLVTVNRNPAAAYPVQYVPAGTPQLIEGGAFGEYWLRNNMSDGSTQINTAVGKPKFITAYPNGMVFVPGSEPGKWKTQILADTLADDVTLTIEWTLPGGGKLTYPIAAKNATSAISPITKVGIIYPANWHTVSGNVVNEKLLFYVNAPGQASVSMKYQESRSNTGFRAMAPFDTNAHPHVPGADFYPATSHGFNYVLEVSAEYFSNPNANMTLTFHTPSGPDLVVNAGVYAQAVDGTFVLIFF